MTLRFDQRLQRLQTRQRELTHWRVAEARDIEGWRCNGAPIALGAPWPSVEGVVNFAAQAAAPGEWPLADTRLALDLGGESLLDPRIRGRRARFLRPRR